MARWLVGLAGKLLHDLMARWLVDIWLDDYMSGYLAMCLDMVIGLWGHVDIQPDDQIYLDISGLSV